MSIIRNNLVFGLILSICVLIPAIVGVTVIQPAMKKKLVVIEEKIEMDKKDEFNADSARDLKPKALTFKQELKNVLFLISWDAERGRNETWIIIENLDNLKPIEEELKKRGFTITNKDNDSFYVGW